MVPSIGLLAGGQMGHLFQGGNGPRQEMAVPPPARAPTSRYSFSDKFPLPAPHSRARARSVAGNFAPPGRASQQGGMPWVEPPEQIWGGVEPEEQNDFQNDSSEMQQEEERIHTPLQRLRRSKSLPSESPIRRLIREESRTNQDAFVDPLPDGLPVFMRHKARSYTVGTSNRAVPAGNIVRTRSLPARLLKPQMLMSLREEEAFIEAETLSGERWPTAEGDEVKPRAQSWVANAPLPGLSQPAPAGPVANSSRRPSYIFRAEESRRSSYVNGADDVAASQRSMSHGAELPPGRRRLSQATTKRSSLSQNGPSEVARRTSVGWLENRVDENETGFSARVSRRTSSVQRRSSLARGAVKSQDPSEVLQGLSEQERRTVALVSAAIGLQLSSALASMLATAAINERGILLN